LAAGRAVETLGKELRKTLKIPEKKKGKWVSPCLYLDFSRGRLRKRKKGGVRGLIRKVAGKERRPYSKGLSEAKKGPKSARPLWEGHPNETGGG